RAEGDTSSRRCRPPHLPPRQPTLPPCGGAGSQHRAPPVAQAQRSGSAGGGALRPRAHEEATKKRPAEVPSPRRPSRGIPSAVRELVLERGGYQCQFRGPDGTRCIQRTHVQVDHIQAFSKEGKSEAGNLQLLCKAHNLFRAKEEFGEELIWQKMAKKGGRSRMRSQA